MEDYTPENQLLYYYCEGVPRHESVSTEEKVRRIHEYVSAKKVGIYFPEFWNHEEVRELKILPSGLFDVDNLIAVTTKLWKVVFYRDEDSVHWVERINLFHLFGLLRIYGKAAPAKTSDLLGSVCNRPIAGGSNSMALVSAINAKDALENRDIVDETEFFRLATRCPSTL